MEKNIEKREKLLEWKSGIFVSLFKNSKPKQKIAYKDIKISPQQHTYFLLLHIFSPIIFLLPIIIEAIFQLNRRERQNLFSPTKEVIKQSPSLSLWGGMKEVFLCITSFSKCNKQPSRQGCGGGVR
ncbi:MAG: hypothetical protein KAJ44_03540 [Thermoplasmatales archaeon]|nr:hypothetical protein [Thermoplasmatales archaeon]